MASYASVMQSGQARSWLGSLVLLPVCVYCLASSSTYSVFHTPSVMMYEAGQSLFGLLGELAGYVGGPLMLVLVPLLLIGYFFYHRYCFGMQVFLVWLGQNLIYIGQHVAGQRDWHYVLTHFDLLHYDFVFASGFFLLGAACFIFLLILPGILSE